MDIQAEQAKRLDLAFCFFEKLCSLSFLLTVKAPIIVRGNDMCRISVSYDTAKRDIVKKNLEESGMSLQDAVRLYLDVLSNGEDVEDLKAYLIKKKVESDSEDTVCHFDNVEDAIKFMDYVSR